VTVAKAVGVAVGDTMSDAFGAAAGLRAIPLVVQW